MPPDPHSAHHAFDAQLAHPTTSSFILPKENNDFTQMKPFKWILDH